MLPPIARVPVSEPGATSAALWNVKKGRGRLKNWTEDLADGEFLSYPERFLSQVEDGHDIGLLSCVLIVDSKGKGAS